MTTQQNTYSKSTRWAMLGAAGYVAPRHMKAIQATGGELIAAMDPNDSVGVLDSHFRSCKFFTSFEKFYVYLDQLRQQGEGPVWLAVCSPNWLHAAHMSFGLKNGMNVLCEKPLVVAPDNIENIIHLERETGKRVVPVLQLRFIPALVQLKQEIEINKNAGKIHEVDLTYITGRGPWYRFAWKMDQAKSGGIAANIGIHFLDMLWWLFGDVQTIAIFERAPDRIAGFCAFKRATVRWLLSTRFEDLPAETKKRNASAHRSLIIDGREIDFSTGFTDLHTLVYEQALAGQAPRVEEARPGIELAWKLMHQEIEPQAARR